MLKTIAIALAVALAALLILAAIQPDTFRVKRVTTVNAPPEKVFPLINDLRRWDAWSPYEKKDPAMKRVLSGASSGPGAVYEWEGNREIGKGRMEIRESSAPSEVIIKLDFVKPFEAHNIVEFRLEPKGDTTDVKWEMYGPAPFVSKVVQLFCSMDTMVGKDFEAGLANLKAVAERS